MATKTSMLIVGEDQPREIWITRTIAIRVFCDCFKHSLNRQRDSWVFLLAIDRDDIKTYIRRADSPDIAPWRELDTYGPVEVAVCGTRIERFVAADPAAVAAAASQLGDLDLDVTDATPYVEPPWWQEIVSEDRRQRDIDERQQLEEYDHRKREGLVDGYEPDRPRDRLAEKREKKKRAAHAQPVFHFGGGDGDE